MYSISLLFKAALLLIITVISAAALNGSATDKQFVKLQGSSILFGLTAISDLNVISAKCHGQLLKVQRGILQKELWALKMFDASGIPGSGFMFGNNYWLGSRETCDTLQHEVKIKMSEYIPHRMDNRILTAVAPFETSYQMVHLRHNSTLQLDTHYMYFAPRVHVGLCLPSACSARDIEWLMTNYLGDEAFAQKDIYDMQLQVARIKDLKVRRKLLSRPSFRIACVMLVFTLVMTGAAAWGRHTKPVARATSEQRANGNSANLDNSNMAEGVTSGDGRFGSLIDCFDISRNWEICFSSASGANAAFPAVNGVRFTCALGVTLFHVLCCTYTTIANKLTMYQYVSSFGNFDIFVDVFFAISGALHGYYFISNVKLMEMIRRNSSWQNLKLMLLMIAHRLIRLLPMYCFVMCMADFVASYMYDATLFHHGHPMPELCEQYWWRSLLFIQNLYNHDEMCGFWTWSLACDMQFFLISTLLLILYVKHPHLAKVAAAAVLLANILYTYLVGMQINFQLSLEASFVHFTTIYMNPLSRIMAYGAGVCSACFYVTQQLRIKAHKNGLDIISNLALLGFFVSLFAPVPQDKSVLESLSLLMFNRVVFAASTCVLLVGNGMGCLQWFFVLFESASLRKFSKCAYAMFLVNPGVICILSGMRPASVYVSVPELMVEYIGVAVLVVTVATYHTLLFDIPYRNISAWIMQRKVKTA